MSALMRQVLERKRQRRRELTAMPFPEKVKIVERMREAITHIDKKLSRPQYPVSRRASTSAAESSA